MIAFQGILGVLVLILFGYIISEHRDHIRWRVVIAALLIQCLLLLALRYLPFIETLLTALNQVALALQAATQAGTTTVFGFLGGGPLPYQESLAGSSFILAFQALPLVIVMSALSGLLFYWRILPIIISGFAWVLKRTLGVSGAAGFAAAGNVFLGMVEAPVLIHPYLRTLSRSELLLLMSVGMATVAGTVMVLYAGLLADAVPNVMGHILMASLLSAPAAILFAQLFIPDDQAGADGGSVDDNSAEATATDPSGSASSALDAITRGTQTGLALYLNIIAMLLVLVALVALANSLLNFLPHVAEQPLTLQRCLGWLFAPLLWLLGLPWSEAVSGGQLMGIKTVLNEFLAYLELSRLPADALSERSRLILLYALCGFANLGSLGIMTGGLISLVPERRIDILNLAPRSLMAGTCATCLTGALAGLIL